MRPRLIVANGVFAALLATGLAAASPSLFSLLDLRIYDAMLRAAPVHPPSNRIAIAAIDDRSLDEIGQWPWPRDVVARLVDRIRDHGASVVAVDLLFAEPDRFENSGRNAAPQTDAALAAAVARGRVVLSYAMTFGADVHVDRNCVLHPVVPTLVDGPDARSPIVQLFQASGIVCSLPVLAGSAASSGFLNASPDRDGLLRRIPLLMEYGGGIYPSLALAAVREAGGIRPLVLAGLAGDRARLTMGNASVPLDERGTLLIRFRGGPGAYERIAAADILNDRLPEGVLRDRIVFVGMTAVGAQDLVSTPTAVAMPGIEVHALAADTLLQGDSVSTPPYSRAYELAATMTLALIAVAVVALFGFVYGSIGAAALVALLWRATFTGVSATGVFVSPVFPTVGLILVMSVLTIAKVRNEGSRAEAERSRRERAQHFTIESLTSLTETRDTATGLHARRTQAYSLLLAERLATLPRFRRELTPQHVRLIAQLSPLHDIGKVGVRDAVLNKPGALSDDEMAEMRRHPVFGFETIARAEELAGADRRETLLLVAKDIVYTHHERWDGRGYPRGLEGDAIPVAGRIVAVVDSYDALSSDRVYRPRYSHEQAVATIAAGRGTHFDPDIVDAFLAVSEQFRQLSMGAGEDIAAT